MIHSGPGLALLAMAAAQLHQTDDFTKLAEADRFVEGGIDLVVKLFSPKEIGGNNYDLRISKTGIKAEMIKQRFTGHEGQMQIEEDKVGH